MNLKTYNRFFTFEKWYFTKIWVFLFFFHEKQIFSDFLKSWSSYFVTSDWNTNFIVSLMLENKSENISSQTRAIHEASDFRCHFFDRFSCLIIALRFTQCITGHSTDMKTSAEYQCIKENYCELIWTWGFSVMIKSVMHFYEFVELLKV